MGHDSWSVEAWQGEKPEAKLVDDAISVFIQAFLAILQVRYVHADS